MNRLQEIETRLSAIKAELETDGSDLDALETEVKELQEERTALLAKVEKRKTLLGSIATGEVGNVVKTFDPEKREEQKGIESKEYRSAFLKALQGKPLDDVEKREYSLVPNTGGAAVPTQTANMIFDNMTKIAPMLSEIQLLRVAGNLRFAVQGVRNAAAAHAENAAIAPAADTLVTVTLTGFEFVKVIRISATIQTMAIDAFESWLTKILGEDLAVLVDNQIINGGTVAGSISAAQVWVAGNNYIQYVPPATIAYADITNCIALLPSSFDANAKFLMSKATFYQHVMQIMDGNGNLIAIQDLAKPGQYRILGYPVLIDDNVTAGEVYLGDYRQVVGNLSSDIKVDRSTESGFLNNSIDFRGTCIFDCDIAQPTAIVKIDI